MEIAATISPLTQKLNGIAIARVNGAFGEFEQIAELLRPYQARGVTTLLDLPHGRNKFRTNSYTDAELFEFAKRQGISYVAVSYVGSANDLVYDYPTCAKIETVAGLNNIEEIAQRADLILIDRRDLATSIGIARVPQAVRHIVAVSHQCGKRVVVASEFLISMVDGSDPTLAEVHNVLDAYQLGADYLLLSEETALGRHPQSIVDMVQNITRQSSAPAIDSVIK